MTACDPLIEPLISNLHSNAKLRVWSLVITIFGDAVLPRGGRVAMQDLLPIIQNARIEAGGLRTALSRLSKDGWIEVEKKGRNSFYTLSEKGLKEFIPATQIIYNKRPMQVAKSWLVAIAPPSGTGLRRAAIETLAALNPAFTHAGLAFWPANAAPAARALARSDCLVAEVHRDAPPQWLMDAASSQELRRSYVALTELIKPITQTTDQLHRLSPLDALTARVLLIHEWRRLALRSAQIPDFLVPQDWPAAACADTVACLYQALLDNSEAYWSNPTESSKELARRFSEN